MVSKFYQCCCAYQVAWGIAALMLFIFTLLNSCPSSAWFGFVSFTFRCHGGIFIRAWDFYLTSESGNGFSGIPFLFIGIDEFINTDVSCEWDTRWEKVCLLAPAAVS